MPSRALETLRLFLRLGVTAFGGPAAHIALMEEETVRRRRWLGHRDFMDLLGATHLIPGPNSTELALFLGRRRAGWRGLFAAGVGFILPAALVTLALAWAYQRYGALPRAAGMLAGIKPVVLALVAQAVWSLAPAAAGTLRLGGIAAAAFAAALAGAHELAILAAAALLSLASRPAPAGSRLRVIEPVSLAALFAVFLKIGAILFGSGYVLLAFLRADLVGRLGWLTDAQVLDAVAAGQMTPGPVLSAATFCGYLAAGVPGAAAATAGIFLPAFLIVAFVAPLLPRLRRSRFASALLDGVNAASLALMAAAGIALARAALTGPLPAVLAAASAVLLVRHRVSSLWLIPAGGLLGAILLT